MHAELEKYKNSSNPDQKLVAVLEVINQAMIERSLTLNDIVDDIHEDISLFNNRLNAVEQPSKTTVADGENTVKDGTVDAFKSVVTALAKKIDENTVKPTLPTPSGAVNHGSAMVEA